MAERPKLDSKTFKIYYYLKEKLIDFWRKNDLQTTGGKLELTDTSKRLIKRILIANLKWLMK